MRPHSSQAGFISIRFIILVLPLVLLGFGGQGLYVAIKNREQVTMTFAEYEQKRPDAEWLQLKETQLNLTEAVYSSKHGKMQEIYIPLSTPGESDEAKPSKIIALLHTKDPQVIAIMEEMKSLDGNQKALMEYILKHHEKLLSVRDVHGLIEIGVDSDSSQRDKIANLSNDLAGDFVVIEEGRRPNLMLSIGLFLGGFVAMWLCWFRRSGSSSPKPPPIPPAHQSTGLPPGTVVR